MSESVAATKREGIHLPPSGGCSGFVVESDVPITARKTRVTYPFNKMEPGDSFAIPDEDAKSVSGAAWRWGKAHHAKFAVRKDAAGRYRCWRVS